MKNRMNKGFSLLEVLIVIAVAAIIVVVISNFGTNIAGLNSRISIALKSKSDIEQTLQIMSNEIRGAVPSAAGAYPISTANSSSLTLYTSINANSVVDQVSYYLASSTLWRAVIAPTGTPATYPTSSQIVNDIVDNVVLASSTPLFSYYDESYTGSGASLSQPVAVASIRMVRIAFYSEATSTPGQPESPQYFSVFIDVRNLNTN